MTAANRRLAPGFSDFSHIRDWVFDLDNTLYPAACDLFAQIDVRMTGFVQRLTGLTPAAARALQKQYYADYGTTLSGLMHVHGLDPAEFLAHVHDIDLSVLPDLPDLRAALAALPGRKLVYTNGSRRHAERVTGQMGLAHLFDASFGIEDAAYVPKPQAASYAAFCRTHAVDPGRAMFFEDIPRNLAPAKALGFATVLVHSDKDWSHEPAGARPASLAELAEHDAHPHIDFVTGDLARFLAGIGVMD
jgi:putative hydrolase of the HAD superfamily